MRQVGIPLIVTPASRRASNRNESIRSMTALQNVMEVLSDGLLRTRYCSWAMGH